MSTSEQHVVPASRQPMPGSPEPAPPGPPLRSPAQIERDIDARRERLSGTIDALVDRVSPKNVVARGRSQLRARASQASRDLRSRAERTVHEARGRAERAVHDARDRATDDSGSPRPEVLGIAAGAVVVVVVVVVLVRRRG